jgi:hypothetical protein
MPKPRIPAAGSKAAENQARNLSHDVPETPQALQRLLDHLQREIVRIACDFTKANDDGDQLSAQYEREITPGKEDSPLAKRLTDESKAADVAYNRTNAELFELCRELQSYVGEPGEPLEAVLHTLRQGPADPKGDGT